MKILLKGCRDCDPAELERLPRAFWMRLLPGLRHYYCPRCHRHMLASKRFVESRRWMVTTLKNFQVPPGKAPPPIGG